MSRKTRIPNPKPMIKLRRYLMEHRPRITQTQLADATGTSQGFINMILLGHYPMSKEMVKKLIKMGLPRNYLPRCH